MQPSWLDASCHRRRRRHEQGGTGGRRGGPARLDSARGELFDIPSRSLPSAALSARPFPRDPAPQDKVTAAYTDYKPPPPDRIHELPDRWISTANHPRLHTVAAGGVHEILEAGQLEPRDVMRDAPTTEPPRGGMTKGANSHRPNSLHRPNVLLTVWLSCALGKDFNLSLLSQRPPPDSLSDKLKNTPAGMGLPLKPCAPSTVPAPPKLALQQSCSSAASRARWRAPLNQPPCRHWGERTRPLPAPLGHAQRVQSVPRFSMRSAAGRAGKRTTPASCSIKSCAPLPSSVCCLPS